MQTYISKNFTAEKAWGQLTLQILTAPPSGYT